MALPEFISVAECLELWLDRQGNVGVDTSNTATPRSQIGSFFTSMFGGNDAAQGMQTVLACAQEQGNPKSPGEFVVRLSRTRVEQRFGVRFDARGGDAVNRPAILINEDAPMFGLAKGDLLVQINGQVAAQKGLAGCNRTLDTSNEVEMRLQRHA